MNLNLDPIVVLAGAAANNGLRMFARELLDNGAAVSIALYQAEDARLAGADDLTVARIIDDRIKSGARALQ